MNCVFSVYQGDTFPLSITVADSLGSPITITYVEFKLSRGDIEIDMLTEGVNIDISVPGQVSITLSGRLTNTLPPGTYRVGATGIYGDDIVKTILDSRLSVLGKVV